MASLKKRADVYYLVFSRRVNGAVEQRAFTLGTGKRAQAERLMARYDDQFRLGEIDPFNGWSPRKARIPAPPEPAHGLTLRDATMRFLASRSHVRQRTLDEYRAQVRRLQESIGLSMPVKHITEEDIRRYAFQPHLSTASQTTYLRFCRMLFRWLAEEGYAAVDISRKVRYPRKDDRVAEKTITEIHLGAVFKAHRAEERDRRLRRSKVKGNERGRDGPMAYPWFRPMIATYFYAGLRAGEGVRLTWERVDLDGGFLRVTGTKTGSERTVPLALALRNLLAAWHRYCGRPTSGLVFRSGDWRGETVPLSTDHVSKTYKRFARAAGLPGGANLHGLRHTCATEQLRRGVDSVEVQANLGHQQPATLRIYVHLNEHDRRATYDRLGI